MFGIIVRCILKTSATVTTKVERVKFSNRQLGIEVLLLLIIVAAIYFFISLISFDPADPGWSQTAWHDPIRNWGGIIGAYLSDIFFQFFGFIAYTIPLLIALFTIQAMIYFYYREQPINYFSLSLRVIGLLAFVVSATGFFALNIQDLTQFQAGGILGDIVADELLPLLNYIGASIILFAVSFACITLLTGLSWLFIAEVIGKGVTIIATPIFAVIMRILRPTRHSDFVEIDHDDQQRDALLDDNTASDNSPTINLAEQQSSLVDEQALLPKTAAILSHDSLSEQPQSIPQVLAAEPPLESELTTEVKSSEAALNSESVSELAITPQQTLTNEPVAELEQYYTESTPVIDENNPPPKLSDYANIESLPESAINPDYYSPIALSPVISDLPMTTESAEVRAPIANITDHPVVEDISLLSLDEDDIIAPIGSYQITQPINGYNEENYVEIGTNDSYQSDIEDDIEYQKEVSDTAVVIEEVSPINQITKENIHDSLIHPLLQKDNKPLTKPTTPLPSLDLLTAPPVKQVTIDHQALKATAELIEKSLADFRVKARVVDYLPGPVITRFEIELAPGVKAARISTLDRDLARSLSMPSVRVVEVIPGKPYIGIELPNQHRQTVYFREVLDSPQFKQASSPLTIVLGKDISGQSVVADLAKMPHVLVAGTTGSGKSVGVNAMILSILYKSQPEDVRFIMIDPKMLELSVYEGIPHLLTDVVTDMKDAANALNWCVNEMEKRYRLMSSLGVRNIAGYNEKIKLAEEMGRPIPDPLWRPGDSMDIDMPMLEKLPYIVVLVDEFADLIMAVGKKVEELIARLAQKARAAGIHLVLATQRPSVDVITGLIKANIPTRIAFTVSSKIDSRTILDQMGAESLLGMGDMLYLAPNSSIPIRVHGAFVRDEEVHGVVQDWKARGIPAKYIENITTSADDSDSDGFDNTAEELDPLFDQVVSFVVDKRRASISSVQRQFRIGYNRAARIVEQMESQGIVSAPSHNGNREVLAPPAGQDY